jgi:RNA polymerase sigma factor (sigma-70 family)
VPKQREDGRKAKTRKYLCRIQASEDPKERQALAWDVVMLNEAAATWLARRFCPHPCEDDISEARLSLYDAALYCHPEKGSSYLSVAAWYYMRRTTGTRNGAGIHIPANVAQAASKVRQYLTDRPNLKGDIPTLRDAIVDLDLRLSELDLHIVLWAVGNPNSNNVLSIGVPYNRRGDDGGGDEAPFDLPYEEPERELKADLEVLKKKMRHLNEFQREAVKTYAQESPPLKAIGARYGVSREWVNQTRKRVVSDLRAALRVDIP